MGLIAETIVAGGRRARLYADRLVKDVRADQFARKPRFETKGGLVVIDTNHPAFVYGHLALYPPKILRLVGFAEAQVAGAGVTPPGAWNEIVKDGCPCQDDADGEIYPPMDAILSMYRRGYDTCLDMVSTVDDAIFDRPTPDDRFRQALPKIGMLAMLYLNNHVLTHMGQISAWRRCVGMGPA